MPDTTFDEDTAPLALMFGRPGPEIVSAAFDMFDAWRARQSDEVRDMDLLEQVTLYAEAAGGGTDARR